MPARWFPPSPGQGTFLSPPLFTLDCSRHAAPGREETLSNIFYIIGVVVVVAVVLGYLGFV
jgi:hypothetical protein